MKVCPGQGTKDAGSTDVCTYAQESIPAKTAAADLQGAHGERRVLSDDETEVQGGPVKAVEVIRERRVLRQQQTARTLEAVSFTMFRHDVGGLSSSETGRSV